MDSITDPQVLNQLIAEATAEPEEDREVPTIFPSDTSVFLPGGFLRQDGSLAKVAEVRELTGQDEEYLAKAATNGSVLNAVLQRGLVSIGGEPATSADIDSMLAGDRDAVLIAIRRATFGNTYGGAAYCDKCEDTRQISIDLTTGIKTIELDNPIADRQFEVETKQGIAVVGLPNGLTQRKTQQYDIKTTAELITLTLAGCLISLDGEPAMGPSTALSLGIADREKIIVELSKRSPGPRLEEVEATCEACSSTLTVRIGLADFFRF